MNAWHIFSGRDTVTYNDIDRIRSNYKSSSADLGVGVVAKLYPRISVYLATDYNANLNSNALEGVSQTADHAAGGQRINER